MCESRTNVTRAAISYNILQCEQTLLQLHPLEACAEAFTGVAIGPQLIRSARAQRVVIWGMHVRRET